MSRLLLATAFFFLALASQAMEVQVYGLFPNMAILEVNGKQRKLHVGESTPEGIKLISANSDEAVLEIKGKQVRHALGTRFSATTVTNNERKGEARIWPQKGMYTMPGAINQQSVQFMVDTGASWVAMNANTARRLGINFRYEGQQGTATTAAGQVSVYMVKLQTVRIGEIELQNVDGAVIDAPADNQVLLGASFLNRVELHRDGQMMLLREK
jgi:aspartyl protease family protein